MSGYQVYRFGTYEVKLYFQNNLLPDLHDTDILQFDLQFPAIRFNYKISSQLFVLHPVLLRQYKYYYQLCICSEN